MTELSTDKKFFVGHNKFYEQILIAKHQCQLGEWIDVEIESVGKYHMMAKTLWRRWLMNRIRTTLLMGNANNDNDSTKMIRKIWLSSCTIILVSSVLYKIYRKIV